MPDELIARAVKDLISNREDIEDYSTVLEELFLHYIPSDEYACLNLDERVSLRNTYIELKTFIDKLIEIRDMSLTAKTA
jgi:hypothetical protein